MDQIDNYKIVEKIGSGGMGEVYKGLDVMLEREVAIKLLKPELKNRPDIIQRFKDELIALGRLNHSNITTLYQYKFDPEQDKYYMALEFARGEELEAILKKQGVIPWPTAVKYTIELLDGIHHAHSFNVVHRDIKPSNIIITDKNSVKILDFGIARILETARLTQTGQFVGTLHYVSPEQIQGQETGPHTDIYSAGVVLYEMLTGHIPFEKSTDYELRRAIVEEKPKPPLSFGAHIPAQLEQIILKALEKKPQQRFASAQAFSQALQKLLLTTEEHAVIAKKPVLPSWMADYPGVVFLATLLTAGGSYWFFQEQPQPTTDKQTTPLPVATTTPTSLPTPPIIPLTTTTLGNTDSSGTNPTQTVTVTPLSENKALTTEVLPPPADLKPIVPEAEAPKTKPIETKKTTTAPAKKVATKSTPVKSASNKSASKTQTNPPQVTQARRQLPMPLFIPPDPIMLRPHPPRKHNKRNRRLDDAAIRFFNTQ